MIVYKIVQAGEEFALKRSFFGIFCAQFKDQISDGHWWSKGSKYFADAWTKDRQKLVTQIGKLKA